MLSDRTTDLGDMFTSLESKLLGELFNCLFEAHTWNQTFLRNKISAQ